MDRPGLVKRAWCWVKNDARFLLCSALPSHREALTNCPDPFRTNPFKWWRCAQHTKNPPNKWMFLDFTTLLAALIFLIQLKVCTFSTHTMPRHLSTAAGHFFSSHDISFFLSMAFLLNSETYTATVSETPLTHYFYLLHSISITSNTDDPFC